MNTCDTPGQIRLIFQHAAEGQGKKRWGEKTAVAYRQLPTIVRAFPDAFYIGLERNISDVAASYERINPTWGAAGGLLHWVDFQRAIARQGPSFRFLRVSYERLTTGTERTLREVCDFIEEPFDPAMLKHHETNRARDLGRSPEFAGAASPVYDASKRSSPPALPDWLVHRAATYAAQLRNNHRASTPVWYTILKIFVMGRLVFREAKHDGMRATFAKAVRSLRRR